MPAHAHQSFIFKTFQGGRIFIFFCKNWHEASYYIKEQTQKYKFEIWLFKSTTLDPQKSAFLVFEERQKNSLCFSFDSALKTINAQMFFWSVFFKVFISKLKNALFWEVNTFCAIFFSVLAFKTIDTQMLSWSILFKTHKKNVINRQKLPKWCFWWSITIFLCVLKNTNQKNICASIVFKAESKPKHEEKFFLGGFLQKQKTHFFGGPKWYFLKVKF